LEADVDPRNTRSVRVLERLGFWREGLQRERYVVGEDVQDAVLYGLLRSEWDDRGHPQDVLRSASEVAV
jgi:RimJ/RimL family protein N-acetyltransferase